MRKSSCRSKCEPEPKSDDDIPFDGIGEPFTGFDNDGVDDGALSEDDDIWGGAPDEEKPFYEEDVEPGESELMPDEDIPTDAVSGEPGADDASNVPEEGAPDFMDEPPVEDSPIEEPSAEDVPIEESVPEAQEPDFADEPESRDSAAEAEPREEHKPEEAPHNEEPIHNEEPLHRDEKTTMDLVSDALQNVVNAPVKKDFRDAADMFKTLRNLSSSLPPVQKDAFFNSLNKLKLDYVIERLSGKPGLLSAASAIRKTGGIAGMKSDNNKPSLLKTMSYMRTLIKSF